MNVELFINRLTRTVIKWLAVKLPLCVSGRSNISLSLVTERGKKTSTMHITNLSGAMSDVWSL